MELTYTQVGDYLLPNLVMDPQPEGDIGAWGRRRKQYLKERRDGTYTAMVLKGTLTQHLIDTDKAARTGLRPLTLESGAVSFEQARLTLDCRRLYADVFKKENFLDPAIFSHYPEDDFHHVYICEIEKVLERCE